MLHTRSSVKATRGRAEADIDHLADREGVVSSARHQGRCRRRQTENGAAVVDPTTTDADGGLDGGAMYGWMSGWGVGVREGRQSCRQRSASAGLPCESTHPATP